MKILYFCHRCGDPIREGETAYLLAGYCWCPGCVENARIAARPAEEAFVYRYSRRGACITGYPAGIPRRYHGYPQMRP